MQFVFLKFNQNMVQISLSKATAKQSNLYVKSKSVFQWHCMCFHSFRLNWMKLFCIIKFDYFIWNQICLFMKQIFPYNYLFIAIVHRSICWFHWFICFINNSKNSSRTLKTTTTTIKFKINNKPIFSRYLETLQRKIW